MGLSYSHGREFVLELRPILEQNDPDALARYLRRYSSRAILTGLLASGHEEAAKLALVCLALVGEMDDSQAIIGVLQGDDTCLASLAEHALWSIWFRAAEADAVADLHRGVELVSRNCFDQAIDLLTRLVHRRPAFAEAFNQLAIACFLKNAYSEAMRYCQEALRLNPCHFGAMAGLGHCFASMGQFEQAIEAYHHSLQLHPRMEGIRQSIHRIREGLRRRRAADTSPPSAPSPL